jgi:hypothetical protein
MYKVGPSIVGFKLGSKIKETPKLNDLIGEEDYYGSKEFTLKSGSNILRTFELVLM